MIKKQSRKKNNYSSVILVIFFLFLILTFRSFTSKPFKVPKEVQAITGTLNFDAGIGTQTLASPNMANLYVTGNVGIGNTNPTNKLHVTGNIGATGWIGAGCEGSCETGGGYSLLYANGNIVNTGTITSTGSITSSGNIQAAGVVTSGGNTWTGSTAWNTFSTAYGSIQLGPANANWAHIYSALPFYFNQNITTTGNLYLSGLTGNYLYNDGTYIRASTYLRATSGIYSDGWVQGATGVYTLNGNLYNASSYTMVRGNDTWLRLNPDGTFTSGVYTPGILRADASMRSPIFYDQDNTGYYVDPHATSVLNSICAGGSCADYLTNDGSYLKTVGDFRVSATFYNDGNAYSTSIRTTAANTGVMMIYNGVRTVQGTTNYSLELQSGSHGAPNGDVIIGSGGASTPSLYVYGPVSASAFTLTSDIRLKENIHTISNALDTIKALRGVTFRWKDNGFDLNNASNKYMDPDSIGFIAQEVETILPQVVQTSANNYKSINYDAIIPIAVTAIQEQQTQITSLQSITTDFITQFKAGLIETKKLIVDGVDILKKLNELSVKVDSQQKQIEELKKSIQELKK